MSSFGLEKLLLSAGEGLHALAERLQELEQNEYPADGSRDLISLLGHVVGRLRSRLLDLTDDAHGPAATEPVVEEFLAVWVSRLAFLTAYLHRWLEIIQMSGKDHGLLEMAAPLEEIVEGVDKGSRILTGPVFQETYSFIDAIGELRQRLTNALGQAEVNSLLAEYPSHIACVQFPYAARDNVLQHTLIAHEIGHLVDTVHRVVLSVAEECEIGLRISAALDTWVLSAIPSKDQGSFTTNKARAALNDSMTLLLKDWIGEMVADLYALHLWGVASFCAMGEYLFTRSMGDAGTQGALDHWSDKHPSLRFRLQVFLDEMDRLHPGEALGGAERTCLEAEIDGYRVLAGSPQGAPLLSGESITGYMMATADPNPFPLAVKVLSASREALRGAIVAILEKAGCAGSPPDYQLALEMSRRLERGMPPCEASQGTKNSPVRIGEILNGGWLYRLTNPIDTEGWIEEARIEEGFQQRARMQDRLLRRGIDLSQLFATYRSRKEDIGHPHS